MSSHVTALPPYGGMTSPLVIGAVVDGVPTTFQTPLSGQRSPVFAVVPMATATSTPSCDPSGRLLCRADARRQTSALLT